MTMTEMILGAIAALIALAALLRPDFERWLHARTGKLKIYQTGAIELGFAGRGPIVALEGMARACDRDFFVHAAEVELTREDGAQLKLPWVGIRSRRVLASTHETNAAVYSIAGSLVRSGEAQSYNLVFRHRESEKDLLAYFQRLRLPLFDALKVKGVVPSAGLEQGKEVRDVEQAYLNEFLSSTARDEALRELERYFFWSAGRYELTLSFHTDDPPRSFSRTWAFVVSPEDSAKLRENMTRLLLFNFGELWVRTNEVYVDYADPSMQPLANGS